MELKIFERALKSNNALSLNSDLLLFNDLEIYNLKTNKSVKYDNLEQLYNSKIDDMLFKDFILNKKEFTVEFDGGRGTGSSNSKMGGGFTSADQRGRKGLDYGKKEFPARLNLAQNQRYRSYEETLRNFEKLYKNADIEYGATIDENGYATRHIRGGSTSVAIGGVKNEMVIHNHPSGGNFSKKDLISIASGPEKGIVAVGSNVKKDRMRYTITKTKNFKSKEFIKGVNKAQWPANLSYDKGADWWLRKNAKTYGYKYSAKKIK